MKHVRIALPRHHCKLGLLGEARKLRMCESFFFDKRICTFNWHHTIKIFTVAKGKLRLHLRLAFTGNFTQIIFLALSEMIAEFNFISVRSEAQ